jgi:hypothetical protein
MKITREFLKEKHACEDGFDWWVENCEGLSNTEQIEKLAKHRNDWANWLLTRVLPYKQRVMYAVFAAEQVIDIFEKKHPNNKAPRLAIEAAKKCIDDPSEKNKKAAAAYADAADAAAYAAYAAYAAADAAAAYAAAAYAAAAYAAAYEKKEMQYKILNYGISLLEDIEDKE